MAKRTNAERRLTEFVEAEFGQRLAAFLLSGYRAAEQGVRCRYVASESDRAGRRREHHVELLATSPARLPHGRDPLVLAALLRMAAERGWACRLTYSLFDLLQLLGWADPLGGMRAAEAAVYRYHRTCFSAVTKRRHPLAPAGAMAARDEYLVTGYDFEDDLGRSDRLDVELFTRVELNPWFVDRLRRRTLFGIEWDNVTALKPL